MAEDVKLPKGFVLDNNQLPTGFVLDELPSGFKLDQPQQPRTFMDYFLPSGITKYQEQPGEQTLWGDVFNRPSAGIRESIRGKGYMSGAIRPELSPTFAEEAKTLFTTDPLSRGISEATTRGLGNVASGFIPGVNQFVDLLSQKQREGLGAGAISTGVGMTADVATNPAEMLLGLLGTPEGQQGMKTILAPAQKVGKALTSTKYFRHGKEWMRNVAEKARQVAQGFDEGLHTAYQNFYQKQGLSSIPVDYSKVDAILLSENIPNAVLKEIDSVVGRINTIGKAQDALQILGKRVTEGAWKGTTTLTGGQFNPRQAAKNVWIGIKGVMREATNAVNPEVAAKLQEFDTLAATQVYPKINQLYRWVGRKGQANTETLANIFRGGIEKTSKKDIIEQSTKTAKELNKYFSSQGFDKDLTKLIKDTTELTKAMKSFESRQFQKKAIGATAGTAGLIYMIQRLLGSRFEQ